MHFVKLMKKATIASLAVVMVAACGMDVEAKTVVQPQQTTKQVVSIYTNGTDVEISNVTNLKINGKKYSKGSIKKKVKTVQTAINKRAYEDYKGSYTQILDEDAVYDSEVIEKERQNFKYITTYDYELDFLKTGTYKISFDKYSYGTTEYEKSADGMTRKVTPVLEKTHYVWTYKVVPTISGAKSIALGKSNVTWTTTKSGSKTTSKTVVKNRYLTGKSGKLVFKMNSNYSLTSAYAVTRNAQGYLVVTATPNKSKITYSEVSLNGAYDYAKIVKDANGKDVYDEKTGNIVRENPATITGTKTDKYKVTTINYGFKDKYLGNSTKYDVSTRTVYIPTRPAEGNGEVEYQKNADGTYVYVTDAATGSQKRVPLTTAVTATVLTTTTADYEWFNGSYQLVETVKEMVISPTAETGIADAGDYYSKSYSDYWTDAAGTQKYNFGTTTTISKGGIARYVTLANGTRRVNPAYTRATKSCTNEYEGSWQVYADGMKNIYDEVYDIDLTTGADTTRWVYVCIEDEDGDYIYKESNNMVYTNYTSDSYSFYAK